ncbi:MAG: endonuclease/exonuclease/phosphatase family protein [Planctomycetota bacterium]
MRILPFALLLVTVSACGQSPRARQGTDGSGSESTFTVMSWNLEWFYDENQGDNFSRLAKEQSAPSRSEWDWRRDAIANSLAQAKPSVVALQEVENRRVLWYLTGALKKKHELQYRELAFESRDHFTEQDVGMLYRSPVDLVKISQGGYPNRLRDTEEYYDVTKHLIAEFEYPAGDRTESVIVVNLHLRARADAEPLRIRQIRLLRYWIRDAVAAGRNVVVLGDFNTEDKSAKPTADSDVGVMLGLDTPDRKDDLVDVTSELVRKKQPTHLMGRIYDRIFCSQSMIEDDPSRVDFVFETVELRKDLAVRGQPDDPDKHYDGYWEMSRRERDLSDHYPVIATFQLK